MANKSIGKATLQGGIEVEAFLDGPDKSMSWMVFKNDQPFLRCPEPGSRWEPLPQWSEDEAAAFLLANALSGYLTSAS